jgi:hypothetical protein
VDVLFQRWTLVAFSKVFAFSRVLELIARNHRYEQFQLLKKHGLGLNGCPRLDILGNFYAFCFRSMVQVNFGIAIALLEGRCSAT